MARVIDGAELVAEPLKEHRERDPVLGKDQALQNVAPHAALSAVSDRILQKILGDEGSDRWEGQILHQGTVEGSPLSKTRRKGDLRSE